MRGPRFDLRKSLLVALLMFGGGAYADCGGTMDQAVCSDVRIGMLYIDAYYDAYISVTGNVAALPCTTSGPLIKLARSSANFKEVYATLLAAKLSDQIVTVRLAPSSTECTVAYVFMS